MPFGLHSPLVADDRGAGDNAPESDSGAIHTHPVRRICHEGKQGIRNVFDRQLCYRAVRVLQKINRASPAGLWLVGTLFSAAGLVFCIACIGPFTATRAMVSEPREC